MVKRFSRAWIKEVEFQFNVKFEGLDQKGKPYFSVVKVKMTPFLKKMDTGHYGSEEAAGKEEEKYHKQYGIIIKKTRPANYVFSYSERGLADSEKHGEYFLGWGLGDDEILIPTSLIELKECRD